MKPGITLLFLVGCAGTMPEDDTGSADTAVEVDTDTPVDTDTGTPDTDTGEPAVCDGDATLALYATDMKPTTADPEIVPLTGLGTVCGIESADGAACWLGAEGDCTIEAALPYVVDGTTKPHVCVVATAGGVCTLDTSAGTLTLTVAAP